MTFPDPNFLWTQGNGRGSAIETESALTVYSHIAMLMLLHLFLHFKRQSER